MDAPDPFPPSDPLGEALHFLRMNGAYYCRSELTAPWGLTLPPMPGYLWFHVVTSGRLWLETGDEEQGWIQLGDLALVPQGEGHVLRSEPGAPAPGILDLERESVSDRYEILRHGEGGAPTGLICGAVRFEHPAAGNLIEILPPTIHIEASSSPRLEWMHSMLRLMASEAGELRPGGEAVITRLGDILVIQAIRAWIESDPAAQTGWLGALQDPQIGRAISNIHRDPARQLDRRLAGPRAGDVALGVRRPLHRARRRAGDELRRPLAHAGRGGRAEGRGRHGRPARRPARLPVRGRVQPRLQARYRRLAGSVEEKRRRAGPSADLPGLSAQSGLAHPERA